MWYVVQVRTGKEESIRKQCEKLCGRDKGAAANKREDGTEIENLGREKNENSTGIIERCFIPRYEESKRYKGEWHKKTKILFPGYVFVVSSNVRQLFSGLKSVIGMTKLLGNGDAIVPLTLEETDFLLQFGGKDQVVKLSEGIIENDRVIVTNGPLKGYEGLICKVDRHKKMAWLEMMMFGRLQKIEVGLEIVEKRQMEDERV